LKRTKAASKGGLPPTEPIAKAVPEAIPDHPTFTSFVISKAADVEIEAEGKRSTRA
jgi:hypothetical protein